MATGVPGTSYTIGGVRVEFPCKAYPTQLSMMSMIIKGIERRQNCLLESPTGSGKSLALLCSCLAWQQNEYRKRDAESIEQLDSKDNECKETVCTCDCGKLPSPPTAKPSTATSPPHDPPVENGPTPAHPSSSNGTCQPLTSNGKCCNQGTKQSSLYSDNIEEEDDDDFKPSKKRFRTSGVPVGTRKKSRSAVGVVFEDLSDDSSPDAERNRRPEADWEMKLKTAPVKGNPSCQCSCHISKDKDLQDKPKEMYKCRKIPRIYFGTRTHKQITQIVRELGRTVYKNVPMCILGSREYTCVHPTVSTGFNKNEGCKELLEGKNGQSCRYFNGAHKMKNQWQLRDRGLTQAWDIEDLVTLGKKIRACPYFAVRSLKDEADIVFCPYNYLVDPMIRMTMDINMRNQIVVLDEAHNIEDSARDAASCTVTVNQLEDTVAELDHHITHQWREAHSRVMHSVIAALLAWVNSHSSNLAQRDFERALRVWSGTEIVAVLAELAITKDTLGTFQHHLTALTEEAEPQKKELENGVSLSSSAGLTLKGLFLIFGFLFKDEMKYMKDFKVAIVRSMTRGNRPKRTENRWISKRSSDQSWTMSLNFWCLNPAVAFSDFGADVRTIILTSGTLSPMASFQSELGVAFPIQLEANHVIHSSQVWVGTVAIGTNGVSLNGSYKNAETYSFQDEIGLLLLQVCQVVPYGVLCFLPSYGMMSKLSQRWKNTGLWDELEKVKVVMMEARGADKVNFDEHLREFYEVIKDCENVDIENQSVTGALFLAVCRGKVSEGMDFADNNARAVMTIGIPFPSIKDTQVELKRQYNDQYSACRGLLTGSEWYEIQAYRAINQALGRCIRHKRDWGALILVDDRFGRNPKKYITGLSKWLRGKVVHHTHAKNALASLDEFAKARQMSPCPELPSLSMCASPCPSQVLSTTFTPGQATPSTPATSLPLPHDESGMSHIVRAMALQSQQDQAPSMSTPKKSFSAAGNSGTPVPIGPDVRWGNVSSTPSATALTPVVHNVQQLVPGPLYMVGPQNLLIPLQATTPAGPLPPPVTPAPLRGRLVEEVLTTGEKVIKLCFAGPGGAAPTPHQVQTVPPPRAVVPPTLTSVVPAAPVGTTLAPRGEALLKRAPLNRVDLCNSIVPARVTDPSDQDGARSKNDSALRKDTLPSLEYTAQHSASRIATPKMKLSYVDFASQLKGEPFEAEAKRGGLHPSQLIDLTMDEEEAPPPTGAEESRYDNNTPDLFDSEVTEAEQRSPSAEVASRGPDDATTPSPERGTRRGTQTAVQASPAKEANSPETDRRTESEPTSALKTASADRRLGIAEDGDGGRQTRSGRPGQDQGKREGRGREALEPGGDGDFLDDILSGDVQKPVQEKNLCRLGLFCGTCNCCFTKNTDGVSLVSEMELTASFSYLAGQARLGKARGATRPGRSSGNFCQCAGESEGGMRQPGSSGLLRVGAGDLRNLAAGRDCTLRSQRDFGLNAHWSEEDRCCYQPITCALCQTKRNATPLVIGYKLVAVGPGCDQSVLTPGQVWLFARDIGHCQRLITRTDHNPPMPAVPNQTR